ncbi:MAG: glutamate 5-kinase [Actinomycetota bacterium]|nr:glutamate 5-kinase [Actinomycetota bacterium]
MTTEVRRAIASASRIVVKIGSSSLTNRGGGINDEAIAALVRQLALRKAAGSQVILVSSGSIAAGFPVLGLKHRPRDLATQQASASVGQGMLIGRYGAAFSEYGVAVGQVLLTSDDVTRRAHYRNAQRTLFRLLELGVVPIVNENDTVATDEIRVGDNDRLAALVAHVVQAQALVLLSDVDGLYDGPPGKGGSNLITSVGSSSDLAGVSIGGAGSAGVGRGGMATKVEAASIANSAGIPVLLTSAALVGPALQDASVGTVFSPTGTRTSTRLLWLAHATTGNGRLHIDAGAARAVTKRGSSLLPAGITSVEGSFSAGDPVDLVDDQGRTVARGLVNFDSSELPGLLGRSTKDLAKELGPAYEREVVHRDDLVLLK